MFALRNMEIELKFKADNILLTDFIDFCKASNPLEHGYFCGYDHFYADTKGSEDFIRHRVGENFNQLTFKRKTTDKNNFIRTENNLTLGKDVTEEQVVGLCQSLGYEFNTSIFKNIYVYTYDTYILAYYVVYDANLKELGRFMEIEMAEDYNWSSEKEAWDALRLLESSTKVLGVTPQGRVKKSLFEQFRRG